MTQPETKLMNLAILASIDGRNQWEPVKPDDVPEWVKDPDVLRQLVAGEMATKGGLWYRAQQLPMVN